MPSPFPGMDPYLEEPEIWSGFHHHLAVDLVAQLNPVIGPKYFADVDIYAVSEEITLGTKSHRTVPDTGIYRRTENPVAVRTSATNPTNGREHSTAVAPILRPIALPVQTKLRTIRIYVTDSGQLVTSIELLSPYNKRFGKGLNAYRNKRQKLLQSPVHLIEIDLLRGGVRPGPEVETPAFEEEYILLLNREPPHLQRISEIWPVALNDALPLLPVPLLAPDDDVTIDLRSALDASYARAGYEWRIDYSKPAPPPTLRPEMAAWLTAFRQEAGLPELQ